MKVCLLGCAKKKEDYPAKAIDIYMPSVYFRHARWYVENIIKPDKIYIFTSYPKAPSFSLQAHYINKYVAENREKVSDHFNIHEQVTYFIDADEVIQPYGFGTKYPNYMSTRFNHVVQPVIDKEFYELELDKAREVHMVGNRTYEKMLKDLRPDMIYHLGDAKGIGHRIGMIRKIMEEHNDVIPYK